MKKINFRVFLISLVCVFVSTSAYAASLPIPMRFGQINKNAKTDFTYLRLKPQDDADTSFGYYKGAFLMILGEVADGWFLVSIGNQQG